MSKREHILVEQEIPPTLWCKFDGDLDDSSPNNYTPQLYNGNMFNYYNNHGIIGETNRCVRYTMDKFANTGDFSVFVRCYPTETASVAFLFAVERITHTGTYAMVNCFLSNGTLAWLTRSSDNAAQQSATTGISLSINNWYDILIVRNNGVLSFYQDGVLKSSHTYAYSIFNANMPCIDIANSYIYQSSNRYFRGYIDEVKYWHNTAII